MYSTSSPQFKRTPVAPPNSTIKRQVSYHEYKPYQQYTFQPRDVVFEEAMSTQQQPIGNHIPGVAFRDKTRLLQFKYFFQYPYLRIFIAYFVIICNFVIYAEDPVAHSHSKCEIPLLGNAFSFVFTKYPPNAFSALKALMWVTAIVMGIAIGKLVLHRWLLSRKLRLSMFSEDQGSWMVCFLFTIIVLVVTSFIYNVLLALKWGMEDYLITAYIGASNSNFMRAAALGTWFGDFITAWMVTDMMLQETRRYKRWKPSLRRWWNKGTRRVALFWFFSVSLTIVVIVAVTTNFINWDKYNKDVVYTSELGRSFLASFILVMDFSIVMQDWDFPMFDSADLDIKLPGVNAAEVNFKLPTWLMKNMAIHITGKWFQYGILFIVLLLDLNMWKNQIFYEPILYGQYTGPEGRIYTVYDDFSLNNYGNATIYSYAWRKNATNPLTNLTYIVGDYRTNSRFFGYSLKLKAIAFGPSILTFIVFGLLIHYFGKKPDLSAVHSDTANPDTIDLNSVTNTAYVDINNIDVSAPNEQGVNGKITPEVEEVVGDHSRSSDTKYPDVLGVDPEHHKDKGKVVNDVALQADEEQITQVEGDADGASSGSGKPRAMSPGRKAELERDLLLCELRVENCDLRVNNLSNGVGIS